MRYSNHINKYKHQFFAALHFYWNAKTIYNIHSPLLFELLPFISKINLSDKEKLKPIRKLIANLNKNQSKINHQDFGEGSRNQLSFSKLKKISHIFKTSSTKLSKGKKIFKICQFFQPKSILELGTNLGTGTSFLAMANPNAQITSIEGDPSLAKLSLKNIEGLNINNVKVIQQKFEDYFLSNSDYKNFELIFIDGHHNYNATLKYFDLCFNDKLNNQVIILDDIYWSKGMTKAWTKIQSNVKSGYCLDFFNFGIVINSNQIDHTIKLKFIEKKWKPLSFGFWG